MRKSQSNDEFEIRAIAGTYVVLLAINPVNRDKLRKDFHGFSICRTDGDGQKHWLGGIKFFDGTKPADWVRGYHFSSEIQPLQTLFWSDYEARPGKTYTFSVTPNYGDIKNLEKGKTLDIQIATEKEDDDNDKHSVWFNRGVIATNQHAVEYQNKQLTPEMFNDVSEEGVLNDKLSAWLSRGLAEACLRFINSTKKGEGIRACFYEFTWLPVLLALKRAHARGVDVHIIYHRTVGKGKDEGKPGDNEKAIEAAGLPEDILTQRTRPSIPHNKFMIKLDGENPKQIWTGSTNITDSGFLGQTNVGHLVKDETLAKTYMEYWKGLSQNPTGVPATTSAMKLSPNPDNVVPENSVLPFFSPRRADNMLDWYGARIKDACSFTWITLPFNVADQILDALKNATRAVRLAILEMDAPKDLVDAVRDSKGTLAFSSGAILGKTFEHRRAGGATVTPISTGHLDDWFIDQELARPVNHGHVYFVHSKIVLIDPLSKDPLVCAGSANFSTNSLISNDENMLLIRGNQRVADIYMTELDRIFVHFYDRDAMNRSAAKGEDKDFIHLDTTGQWLDSNFTAGSYKNRRLMIFFATGKAEDSWATYAEKDPDLFKNEEQRRHDLHNRGHGDGEED